MTGDPLGLCAPAGFPLREGRLSPAPAVAFPKDTGVPLNLTPPALLCHFSEKSLLIDLLMNRRNNRNGGKSVDNKVVCNFCLSDDYHYRYCFCWIFDEFTLVSRAPFIRHFIFSFVMPRYNFISEKSRPVLPPSPSTSLL